MQQMDRRTQRLLEGPIAATLLRLAAPNIVVMGMQAAVGLIETYFVAKLGVDALAGIAAVEGVLSAVLAYEQTVPNEVEGECA